MSLYDDELLESNKDGSGKGLLILIIDLFMSFFLLVGGWSGSIKLLQGSIHAKKFHQQQQLKVESTILCRDLINDQYFRKIYRKML
jgi:hypothetical protein